MPQENRSGGMKVTHTSPVRREDMLIFLTVLYFAETQNLSSLS
jgi:hypothetical protein